MVLDYFDFGEIKLFYSLHRTNNIKEDLEKKNFPSEMPVSTISVVLFLLPFTKELNAEISHLDIKCKIPKYKHLGFQKC